MINVTQDPIQFNETSKQFVTHLAQCQHDLSLLLTFLTKQRHPLSRFTIVKPYEMLKKLPTFYPEVQMIAGYHLEPNDVLDPANNFKDLASLWVKPSSLEINPRDLSCSFAVGFRLDKVAFKTDNHYVNLTNIDPERDNSRVFELKGKKPAQYVILRGTGTEDADVVDVMINYVRGVKTLVKQTLQAEQKNIDMRVKWANEELEGQQDRERRSKCESARIKAGPYSWEKLFKGNDIGTLFSD